jgi:hypothetical protein
MANHEKWFFVSHIKMGSCSPIPLNSIVNLPLLAYRIIETATRDMIQKTWQEAEFRLDGSRATNGANIEMY